MQWMNGWIQTDERFYWKSAKDHTSHVPYTNVHTGEIIRLDQVLHSGFGLLKGHRMPARESAIAIKKWRQPPPETTAESIPDTAAESAPQMAMRPEPLFRERPEP